MQEAKVDMRRMGWVGWKERVDIADCLAYEGKSDGVSLFTFVCGRGRDCRVDIERIVIEREQERTVGLFSSESKSKQQADLHFECCRHP